MILQWIAILIFIIIGVWVIKMEHHGRKVKIVIVILIGALLYFSIIGVFSSEKVDLTSPRGVVNSVYIYFGWMGNTISQLWDIGTDTVSMVGNAIKIRNSTEEKPKK